MPNWRITFDGTGQAIGDRLDETLYVASGSDILPTGWSVTENTGTGGLIKLQNTFFSEGARGLRCETTASSSCYVSMLEDGTWGTTRWIVADVFIPTGALIPANWDIFQPREAATLFRVRINVTTRTVSVVLGSGSQATSSMSLAFDTHYRLAFKMVYSATVGILECKIYAGNSSSPLETVTASGLNTGVVLATNVRLGIPIAFGPAGPFYLDNLRGSDVAEPGPSGATLTGNPGKVRRWNGSAWVTDNKIKRWNGSAWVMARVKPYD